MCSKRIGVQDGTGTLCTPTTHRAFLSGAFCDSVSDERKIERITLGRKRVQQID